MTHRAGRVALERKLISEILYAEPALCEDCMTVRFRLSFNPETGAHVVELIHRRTCPCRRLAWSRRGCDDYIRSLLIIGGIHLAEYNDVEPVHR